MIKSTNLELKVKTMELTSPTVPHIPAKQSRLDGKIYEGSWKNGKMHGLG
ncbi:MAG TPA: hypothetical protein GXZ27_09010, partial [Thermoanaerobacterales bacterium]|nr:hypothetical protein [Thermoanaerobacterales bacterium]